jgi:hypothetical protein
MDSLNAASVVGLALALVAIILAGVAEHMNAIQVARVMERSALEKLIDEFYSLRPTGDQLYGFVPDLALRRRIRWRSRRLTERSVLAARLDPHRLALGCELARRWVDSVGAMAHAASIDEEVPLRRFLRTYHLAVIRDGLLVLPFLFLMAGRDELDAEQIDRAAWGLALVELAAFYNSLARQQRQAVYFHVQAVTMGPVLRAPRLWKRPVLSILDRLFAGLPLRHWRRLTAGRRLTRLGGQAALRTNGKSRR